MHSSPMHRRFETITDSREPMFASGSERRSGLTIYFDIDGAMACINGFITSVRRPCVICHNHCILFVANEDLTYTCSACGKFPKELLLRA